MAILVIDGHFGRFRSVYNNYEGECKCSVPVKRVVVPSDITSSLKFRRGINVGRVHSDVK